MLYFPRAGSTAILLCLTAVLIGCAEKKPVETASQVFLNGVVYTADAQQSVASAIAISGDRILFVGDDVGARALVDESTEVVDLNGAMLLPGLHDMHIHPMGIIESDGCDLQSEPLNLQEMAAAVSACLEQQPLQADEWLSVDQWNFAVGNQPAGGLQTLRQALDQAAPENPVILWGNDGHHGAVNSQALARGVNARGVVIGISAETIGSDFAEYQETIGVDASGQPNGELHETARDLVQPPPWGIISGVGVERMPEVAAVLAASGITAVQDAASPPETLELYKSLLDSGKMSFSLSAALFQDVGHFTDESGSIDVAAMIEELQQVRAQYANVPEIQTETVKVFVDGVMEGNPLAQPPTLPNAAVLAPYKQPLFEIDVDAGRAEITGYVDIDSELCQRVREEGERYADIDEVHAFERKHGFYPKQCRVSRGVLEHPQPFIHSYMQAADAAGFKIHTHVIGDRAVATALDGFEMLRKTNGNSGLRHSMGHIQLVAPQDYQRIGDLGLYLVFTYAWLSPELLYDLTVNPFIDQLAGIDELYRPDSYYMTNNYPAAQLQALGAILAGGSDAPVDARDPRPFFNIQQAVTRASADGIVLGTEGRIDIKSALDAYSINGARLFGHDAETGSLEPGKRADLVVIDRDLLALAATGKADQIAQAKVLLTLFKGQTVYEAD